MHKELATRAKQSHRWGDSQSRPEGRLCTHRHEDAGQLAQQCWHAVWGRSEELTPFRQQARIERTFGVTSIDIMSSSK